MKVTAQEIKEQLETGQYTQGELSDIYNVTTQTIKNKIRELRKDGEPIIHTSNGMMLLTRDDLTDSDIAEAFQAWVGWLLSVVKGMMFCAKPVKPLFPALRRNLKDSLTAPERKILARSCVVIKGLLDYVEVESEDEI